MKTKSLMALALSGLLATSVAMPTWADKLPADPLGGGLLQQDLQIGGRRTGEIDQQNQIFGASQNSPRMRKLRRQI